MKKYTFTSAIILVLSAGFTACSQDYLEKPVEKKEVLDGSTYMSISFVVPVTAATPVSPTTRADNARHYQHGSWNGKDKFKAINVYVFDKETGKMEAFHKFTETQLRVLQKPSGAVKVSTNDAMKVKKGLKNVFVEVNPIEEGADYLEYNIGSTTYDEFFERYKKIIGPKHKNVSYNIPTSPQPKMYAEALASVEDGKDVILMTGQPATDVDIEDGVTREQAIAGSKNQAKFTVERALARVIVTTQSPSFEIKGDDPRTPNVKETDFVLATLSEITYTVAQSAKTLYRLKKIHGTGKTQDDEDQQYEETPYFDIKTRHSDYFWDMLSIEDYVGVASNLEYTGLWRNESTYDHIKQGFEVKTRSPFLNDTDKKQAEIDAVSSHITASSGDRGLFIYPLTHQYGETPEASGYRKTNTPYILIRGLLTPKIYVDANGDFKTDEGLKGKDFYIGDDGVIYATKAGATDDTHHGFKGQYARKYAKGKALYFLWLHPDQLDHPLNSPVDRNNIYHVQIKGVNTFGANWNPLVPYFYGYNRGKEIDIYKAKFKDGDPLPDNPNNPDDRPNDNDIEPPTPPVNPFENLTAKQTWMATEVTVVPWTVHSYSTPLK